MSFESVFSKWLKDSVTVETIGGIGFDGITTSSSTVAGVMVEEETRLVRSAAGNEVVSSATVYAPLDEANKFLVDSRVTLPSGRVTTVLASARHDVPGVFAMVAVNLA